MFDDVIVTIMSLIILTVARFFALQIPYVELGFHCDQEDIAWPSRKDTMPASTMFWIYGIIAAIAIPVSELSLVKTANAPLRFFKIRQFNVHPFFLKVLFFYLAFMTSVMATSLATNIFKRTSSRLRPNFLDNCKPANLSELCGPCSHAYISQVECLGDSSPDEHYSFPSGHAAHSIHFAVFMILYVQRRMRLWVIARAFLQYTLFVLTTFVCLTRIRDYKHRYTDVFGGALCGGIIAYGMIHLILGNFDRYRYVAASNEDEHFGGRDSAAQSTYGALGHSESIKCLVK